MDISAITITRSYIKPHSLENIKGKITMRFYLNLLTLLILMSKTGIVNALEESKSSALDTISKIGNKYAPTQITPTLILKNISASNDSLTYHYKSTSADASRFNVTKFKSNKFRELTKYICEDQSQKLFRDLKVILNYEYIDKNDNLLAVISIDTNKC
ncbi:hypothetical protein [Vibrio ziniensis]|uniref:Uncharacterized protein n=1 Tax=Vibrio ziniensis TaxID=2711221 RepID=A0A6G7CH95_9VIBR|nr:hypothetical protein [Vibrio ziniensis]QIH41521.1 hypothetical protein G5S32_05735 [Vibrio ziniensis]